MFKRQARFQNASVAGIAALTCVSFIGTQYPEDMPLHHIPTAIFLVSLIVLGRWFRFTNYSFACLLGFVLLHVVGARYVYSNVPYDDWAERIVGKSLSSAFGLERNHYDRVVHLGFGLLLVFPIRELYLRFNLVADRWSRFFAVESIIALSMIYEVFEWIIAVTMAPEMADRYLGQQGDYWDGQKDMALAMAGAVIAMLPGALMKKNRSAENYRPT